MQLIRFVTGRHVRDELIELRHRPAIETVRRDFQRIGLRIEVVQIAQQEPQRIADLAVLVAKLLDRLRAGGNVVLVIDRAAPQAQQIRAMTIDFLRGGHVFLVALADLRAIRLDDEAVRQHLLVRRLFRSQPRLGSIES